MVTQCIVLRRVKQLKAQIHQIYACVLVHTAAHLALCVDGTGGSLWLSKEWTVGRCVVASNAEAKTAAQGSNAAPKRTHRGCQLQLYVNHESFQIMPLSLPFIPLPLLFSSICLCLCLCLP